LLACSLAKDDAVEAVHLLALGLVAVGIDQVGHLLVKVVMTSPVELRRRWSG
jgi:hypothetical protein